MNQALFLFTIERKNKKLFNTLDQVGLNLKGQHQKTLSYNYQIQSKLRKMKIYQFVKISPMLTLLFLFPPKSEYSRFRIFWLRASAAALSPILSLLSKSLFKPIERVYSHSVQILTLVKVKAILCRDLKTVKLTIYHKIAAKC